MVHCHISLQQFISYAQFTDHSHSSVILLPQFTITVHSDSLLTHVIGMVHWSQFTSHSSVQFTISVHCHISLQQLANPSLWSQYTILVHCHSSFHKYNPLVTVTVKSVYCYSSLSQFIANLLSQFTGHNSLVTAQYNSLSQFTISIHCNSLLTPVHCHSLLSQLIVTLHYLGSLPQFIATVHLLSTVH